MSNVHAQIVRLLSYATPARSNEEPEDEHITTDQPGQAQRPAQDLWAVPGKQDAGRSGVHEQKSGPGKETMQAFSGIVARKRHQVSERRSVRRFLLSCW